MLYFIISMLLLSNVVFSSPIMICNECSDSIKVDAVGYDAKYEQCTFDTTFSVSGNNIQWLFLGTACDDRCSTDSVGEGYLCHSDMAGYYEIEDSTLGEPIQKYEFHHYNCSIVNNSISLHVHRFLPNKWMKNITIPYYIAGGQNEYIDFSPVNLVKFEIKY